MTSYARRIFTYVLMVSTIFAAACEQTQQPDECGTYSASVRPLDNEIIQDLVSEIENDHYGVVYSLVIMQGGEITFEDYFNSRTSGDLQPLYSVTKSFLSALIGIAIDQGKIASVNEKVLPYFTEYEDIANINAWKQELTIEHLLTMSAGFHWDELSLPYTDPENDFRDYLQSDDRIKYVLDLPVQDAPGTRMAYNTGLSMLLSAILTKATGLKASDFAAENLFNYLGITEWTWSDYKDTLSVGGWGLSLLPTDMVKLGQLYIQEGCWGEHRVISKEWVARSIQPFGSMTSRHNYSYQWWRYSETMSEAGLIEHANIYFALGRGGQFIWVIPMYDMVVVSTAWNDNNGYWSESMLWDSVLPAVR
ncbi:MAG: serine hydrolase [Fidelibacterota bacterium]|nr:MAG: serine hydrolase [Candidatus Neomarinimicrobiota bacterium]